MVNFWKSKTKFLMEQLHLYKKFELVSQKISTYIAREFLLPFQKGIKLCNKSLKELLPYLEEKYKDVEKPILYILTNRFN